MVMEYFVNLIIKFCKKFIYNIKSINVIMSTEIICIKKKNEKQIDLKILSRNIRSLKYVMKVIIDAVYPIIFSIKLFKKIFLN